MSLFDELKRRNVFRVAFAYIVIGWLILQAGDTLAPALHLPDWANSLLVFFLLLGFPLALFFAWVFDMTPEGVKLEKWFEPGLMDYLKLVLVSLLKSHRTCITNQVLTNATRLQYRPDSATGLMTVRCMQPLFPPRVSRC